MRNDIGASRWGYLTTRAELDRAVGAGESDYIDHAEDVFYVVLAKRVTEGGRRYVDVITLDGRTYACLHGGETWQYSYTGMGANQGASHPTDYDWASDDGRTWARDRASKDVRGKTVTLSVWRYDEDVDDGNAETALAGRHEVVFGPQEITCDWSRSYKAR